MAAAGTRAWQSVGFTNGSIALPNDPISGLPSGKTVIVSVSARNEAGETLLTSVSNRRCPTSTIDPPAIAGGLIQTRPVSIAPGAFLLVSSASPRKRCR